MKIRTTSRRPAGWMLCAAVTFAALSWAPAARADWTGVFPGVGYSQWSQSGPNRISALRVDLCHPGVELRATKYDERRRTPSSFGTLVGADAVINADFFEYTNYTVSGLAVGDGQRWPNSSDPAGRDAIAFGANRVQISPQGSQITDYGWIHDAVGGMFAVLKEGTIPTYNTAHCTARHPRTIVGLSKDERILYMVVVDGRSTTSRGMTCPEQGQLMKDLGAWTAISLDGGGSSAMWVRGKGVVNRPSDGSQRTVANHLAVKARGSGLPESCNNLKGDFEVKLSGATDFYDQGGSSGVPDLLVGDEFTVDLLLHNTSSTIYRNVKIDYRFASPYLAPTNYIIHSDHPAYDRATWQVNSADSNAANPPKNNLGASGTLAMDAFSARETKRVRVTLRAQRYSKGQATRPDVRSWVRHIDNLYGEQTAWDQTPSNANLLGSLLQDRVQVDILSPYEWQFDGGAGELEGWQTCEGHSGQLATNDAHTAMTSAADDPARCAESPPWTAVDANTYDQMVIRLSNSGTGATFGVNWRASEDAPFDAQQQVKFVPDASAEPRAYVLDLAQTGAWSGTIKGLQLDWQDARLGDVGVDAIFFQSSTTSKTSSADEQFVDQAPVRFDSGEEPGEEPGGEEPGGEEPGGSDTGDNRPDAGFADATAPDVRGADTQTGDAAPGGGAVGDATGNGLGPNQANAMAGGCGCSATATPDAGGLIPAMLGALYLLGARRWFRRRSPRP